MFSFPRGASLALALLLAGCASFRPVGANVVGGALDELERRGGTSALTRGAVSGARDELTSEESREKIRALQAAMMEQMTQDGVRLRQELLGEAFRADVERARAEFLEKTRLDLALMRDDLLGPRTRDPAGALADRMVGDVTREHLAKIRDEILGERSRLMAQQLVQQTGRSMQLEMSALRVRLEGEKKALKDELHWTFWISASFIAALCAAVTTLIVAARRRNRMIAALAEPIKAMTDGRTYEELTRRIVDRARELGVAAVLRDRLPDRPVAAGERPEAKP